MKTSPAMYLPSVRLCSSWFYPGLLPGSSVAFILKFVWEQLSPQNLHRLPILPLGVFLTPPLSLHSAPLHGIPRRSSSPKCRLPWILILTSIRRSPCSSPPLCSLPSPPLPFLAIYPPTASPPVALVSSPSHLQRFSPVAWGQRWPSADATPAAAVGPTACGRGGGRLAWAPSTHQVRHIFISQGIWTMPTGLGSAIDKLCHVRLNSWLFLHQSSHTLSDANSAVNLCIALYLLLSAGLNPHAAALVWLPRRCIPEHPPELDPPA